MALPEWIDADSAGPLSGDLPPVGEGCERPDLEAELVRRSAGLRYRNAEGTAGATLARHLPADLDELPGWQQPIQFIETALAKARDRSSDPGTRRPPTHHRRSPGRDGLDPGGGAEHGERGRP